MYHKTMSINSENYIVVDYIKRELQVAIWRDSARKRLVIAFRGTEQVGYIYIYIHVCFMEISSVPFGSKSLL